MFMGSDLRLMDMAEPAKRRSENLVLFSDPS
jgi:hypothetical protein